MLAWQSLVPRDRMLHMLDELATAPVGFTLYISSNAGGAEISRLLGGVLDSGQISDEIVERSSQSVTGSVVFWGEGRARVIWPPFPLRESGLSKGCDGGRLKQMLGRDLLLGLVLVRLGYYAVGLFRGEELLEGKAGTGLVHARHHKGGSSANRFARHREKQMEYFFSRIELHSRELLEKHMRDIDHVLYGGTRDTLLRMWKQCRFFQRLEDRRIDRLLTVREPKKSNLGQAIREAYSCRVFELVE